MWRVNIAAPASKAIESFPRRDQDRIVAALESLVADPFGGDTRSLGVATYRRRVGSYRIFFDVHPDIRFVQVTSVTRRTSTKYRKRRG